MKSNSSNKGFRGFRSGETIAERYRVEGIIGYGGMGVLYRAEDMLLNRRVALKTIRLDRLEAENSSELTARMLLREARASAKLSHPNIVVIYDIGRYEGYPYICMELIEGRNFKSLIHGGSGLNLGEVISSFEQICKGLDYAHKKEILHRDIKPENIMITEEGLVKLTDFGIAKILSPETSTIMSTGNIACTYNYSAPEYLKDGISNIRTDIFSLGCVFYEMLTGRMMFKGEGPPQVWWKIMNEKPVKPSMLNGSVPPELDEVSLRAVAKSPEDRYARVTDFFEGVKGAVKSIPGKAETRRILPAEQEYGTSDTELLSHKEGYSGNEEGCDRSTPSLSTKIHGVEVSQKRGRKRRIAAIVALAAFPIIILLLGWNHRDFIFESFSEAGRQTAYVNHESEEVVDDEEEGDELPLEAEPFDASEIDVIRSPNIAAVFMEAPVFALPDVPESGSSVAPRKEDGSKSGHTSPQRKNFVSDRNNRLEKRSTEAEKAGVAGRSVKRRPGEAHEPSGLIGSYQESEGSEKRAEHQNGVPAAEEGVKDRVDDSTLAEGRDDETHETETAETDEINARKALLDKISGLFAEENCRDCIREIEKFKALYPTEIRESLREMEKECEKILRPVAFFHSAAEGHKKHQDYDVEVRVEGIGGDGRCLMFYGTSEGRNFKKLGMKRRGKWPEFSAVVPGKDIDGDKLIYYFKVFDGDTELKASVRYELNLKELWIPF